MTIPLKVAIPLLILIPLVAWFSGTRKYDFMTPRVIPASELRPDFASPVDREIAELLRERPPEVAEVPAPELPVIDFGDLQISPTLDEYRAESELGAVALLDLARRLQNAGHIQRSVLAFERVLDSSPPGSSPQAEAVQALVNLKALLPMWNPDSNAAIPLEIHLNTARDPASLKGTITTLTELIIIGSGQLCRPSFHIHQSPLPEAPLPSLPVAVWMTVPEEDPEKPSLAVVTVAPRSDDELDARLTHGLYRLLVRRITAIGRLTPPPPLLQDEDPENAIVNQVTRLAWQEILSTPFQSLVAGPPSDALSTEATSAEEEAGEETAEEIEKIEP